MATVLKSGVTQDKGEMARLQTYVGAIAIGDMIKSTLGPWGMNKLLQPAKMEASRFEKANITNDGATILKNLWADNPAAKILIDLSMQQDAACGDGTTGVVLLAAELLRNAEALTERKIHPQVVIQGYRLAFAAARDKLKLIAVDFREDQPNFRQTLLHVASTALSSKFLGDDRDQFARLAVDALLRTRDSTNPLELIPIIKKQGGTLSESFLADGFLIEKKFGIGHPRVVRDCRILLANTPMDSDKVKIYGAKVKVDSFLAVGEIEKAEQLRMTHKVEKIAAHGCNVFINRQLIYNYPENQLKMRGIACIEHADFEGVERLAKCLGADIVSSFDDPKSAKLGHCGAIETVEIGGDSLLRFVDCAKGAACTIVLRGSSSHLLDEAERSLHDALALTFQTLQSFKVVGGAGAAEMAMAEAVDIAARKTEGKVSQAMEYAARALRRLPEIILENGGLDSIEIVSRLTAMHARGEHRMGIDAENEGCHDVIESGILESYACKLSQVALAFEAAEMIIRVDDIIRSPPRPRRGI